MPSTLPPIRRVIAYTDPAGNAQVIDDSKEGHPTGTAGKQKGDGTSHGKTRDPPQIGVLFMQDDTVAQPIKIEKYADESGVKSLFPKEGVVAHVAGEFNDDHTIIG